MAAKKGVVIGIKGRSMVVMTEQGEFRNMRTPRPTPLPGDVVTLPDRGINWMPLLAAASILLILVASIGLPGLLNPAVASIDLDVGGGLTISIDSEGRVCDVEGLDGAGKRLVATTQDEIIGIPAADAVEKLVARAAESDLLDEEDDNLIMISPVIGQKNCPVTEDQLRVASARALEKANLGGYLVVDSVEAEKAQNAHRNGCSVGKLTVNDKLQQLLPEVPLPAASSEIPGHLKKHSIEPQQLFQNSGMMVQRKGNPPQIPPGQAKKPDVQTETPPVEEPDTTLHDVYQVPPVVIEPPFAGNGPGHQGRH